MKRIPLLLFLIWIVVSTYGQQLKGTVYTEQNTPIENVHILNYCNGGHTHSDSKGYFVLSNITIGDTLTLTHIAYESMEWIVNTTSGIQKIRLKEKEFALEEVVIIPKMDALNLLSNIDLKTKPVNSSQDILRQVPGLFIGQHAGGGKAEQMFIRGFDIDHGTDITITADGLPVNMVSQAHGQGYADLHFIIPETVEKIDYGKGPYYADKGNFNTAAYVNFKTKEQLESSQLKLEVGQFNTQRLMGLFSVLNRPKHHAYLATEYIGTDGPFDSPQHFSRINMMGKYTGFMDNGDKIGIQFSHFTSKWDASGQIPQRAVDDGSIGRFGAIDDTEGGFTDRTNFVIKHNKQIDAQSCVTSTAYYSHYNFELYSNFTFFLNDSINGDQIKQKENRNIYGLESKYIRVYEAKKWHADFEAGLTIRNDQSQDNELSHTKNRLELLEPIRLGFINETNFGSWVDVKLNIGKWTINPALRLDYFNFQYTDALIPSYKTDGSSQAILCPKLNILYTQSSSLQLYVKAGKGFHSNDSRVSVTMNNKESLPAAYGTDVGFIWKPLPQLFINTAYWYLFLEDEIIYVGDEGITEPVGKTQRHGLDLSIRYQTFKYLFWNLDVNYAFARSLSEPKGEDYIPLAPNLTAVGGLYVMFENKIYGGLNLRYLGDRPANKDNSIVAKGYTILDVNAGFTWRAFNLELQVQNLLNSEWNETQFASTSRLQHEAQPVEEIHFIPGTPLFLKVAISYRF